MAFRQAIRWRRRCSSASLSLGGARFLTELRQCEGSRGAYARPGPLLDLILGRRKLDQTTLVGAQRSCCWLFHFHRAVFWPDRTRSCFEHSNTRTLERAPTPPVIPLESIHDQARVDHPRLSESPSASSPSVLHQDSRCTGVRNSSRSAPRREHGVFHEGLTKDQRSRETGLCFSSSLITHSRAVFLARRSTLGARDRHRVHESPGEKKKITRDKTARLLDTDYPRCGGTRIYEDLRD